MENKYETFNLYEEKIGSKGKDLLIAQKKIDSNKKLIGRINILKIPYIYVGSGEGFGKKNLIEITQYNKIENNGEYILSFFFKKSPNSAYDNTITGYYHYPKYESELKKNRDMLSETYIGNGKINLRKIGLEYLMEVLV